MELVSARAQEMAKMLPTLYDDSSFMAAVLEAQGSELDKLRAAIADTLNAFFVRTAPDWALDRWEAELDLPPAGSLTISERQDRLVSKLRGYGTANIATVESVAESYVYGAVQVDDQSTDATLPAYTIRVSFIDERGVPSNMKDVEAAIRDVVPAHLAIVFEFNYTTWNEIDTVNAGAPRTWDEWDIANGGVPYTWDEMEVLL